ncbi:MAG: OOP family OmpA-OmpF porin [Myxococcota bacterium]|jgi:OOP family OmpA-OmpF porin
MRAKVVVCVDIALQGESQMRRCFSWLIALALVVAAPVAQADDKIPHPAIYVGGYIGGNFVLDGWDLHENADAGQSPNTSLLFGLRVGVQLMDLLALEAGLAVIPYSADVGDGGLALGIRGDALITPFNWEWQPYGLVGGGFYSGSSDTFGSDADWEIHYGLGMRKMLGDMFALRVEFRHNLTDSFEAGLASIIELTAGVDVFVWGAKTGPPTDEDRDGIIDDDDLCPEVPGSVTAKGCPDADGDGIKDGDDKCPSKPGPHANMGCPDTDGDGLTDDIDECPGEAGPAIRKGCPVPPPDLDGDGIFDTDDVCPTEAGPFTTAGCPDRDGDYIVDADDKCPDQPGIAAESGCLPKIIEKKFSGAIRGIYFSSGSAKIQRKSHRLLNRAAKLLNKYPEVRIEISGHTDNQGKPEYNRELSQKRADSVRTYLMEKSVDGARLIAIGHGETKPVADNGSRRGRSKNRRIEFKVIGNN